jgi:hypothetical protein
MGEPQVTGHAHEVAIRDRAPSPHRKASVGRLGHAEERID